MKIYTKTGDDGETGLYAGGRVSKDHPRIEAIGTVDELNALLGQVVESSKCAVVRESILRIQHELFCLGAELATPKATSSIPRIGQTSIDRLEQEIDILETSLSPLTQFILPGGNATACSLHHARAVCRRAERRVVTASLVDGETIAPSVIRYLNRLGDYLFVAARYVNHDVGLADIPWEKPTA